MPAGEPFKPVLVSVIVPPWLGVFVSSFRLFRWSGQPFMSSVPSWRRRRPWPARRARTLFDRAWLRTSI